MKIEVDIDDNIYQTWERFFGTGFDIAGLLSSILKDAAVLMVVHPEDFLATFGPEAIAKLPDSVRQAHEREVKKYLPKSEDEQ